MKSIIATIVISILLLGITMMGIELWRSNMELISLSAAKTDALEKIKATDILPLEGDLVQGSDVISSIRYFSKDNAVTVEIRMGGTTKHYVDDTYRSEAFDIPYEGNFLSEIIYDGVKIKKIIYTQNN